MIGFVYESFSGLIKELIELGIYKSLLFETTLVGVMTPPPKLLLK